MSKNEEMKAFVAELKTQFKIIGLFLVIFWAIEIINQYFFSNNLNYLGIVPRNVVGLRGILFAPFLHVDFPHLLANTVPFAILGWFVMLQNTRDFYLVTLISSLSSGVGVWLFAQPNSITMGASGVIFGFLGFLLARGYFQKNAPSIALSLTVIFLYGGMIWGIFPSNPSVSWLGHLFGFLGGIYTARLIASK
ncbi:rhomboid family intramembrane serine protease [Cyanobacterium stanieri LEGE 03274]|uniref:Rhomboid family intramembrane serine protease n=1 Tax=Cyanobacterium stanieri LEGE 03274 TaxID=1828756 RepID=A0ABR9V3Z5_9CHRO|nr:rhomboid family intramembrane serine protease [Cyanobacterium stanieri]MBE9222256.1 rhomboid family intramembrane serine protease [Cyanobacterium stanieri LEGE 03274]